MSAPRREALDSPALMPYSYFGNRNMRHIWLAVAVLALIVGGACGSEETPARQASDELDRGLHAHSAGRLDEAAAAYHKVLTYDPQNKYAFYNLGLIDDTLGHPGPAESYYRLALNVDPDYVPALFNLAILRNNAGSAQEAVDLYRKALTIEPDYAEAHWNLGVVLQEMGEEREAKEHLARAIELDPNLQARTPTQSPTPTR